MGRRSAIALTLATLIWSLGAGAATACLPPSPVSTVDQAAADLSLQASAWTTATSVYIGRIAERRPLDSAGRPDTAGPRTSFSHEIVLVAEALLKGPLPAGAQALTFALTPACIPSDIARGQVGDRFVVYTGAAGASARSGMIALDRVRHPETLAAIADSAASATGL